ncbi:MAG: DNA repair protein RecO [Candidatus Saccharibacteria bacterium]|nr:DNA repair protein RecO [Candidatus Saccharibacteria bacterium]
MNHQFTRLPALILRRTNYGEADRIINFLTSEGQITALAKAVRKPKSKLAGALEPFSLIDLVIIKTPNGMGRITGASLIEHYGQIIGSYDRIELGYYFLKIVNRLSRDIDSNDWFNILHQTLQALNNLSVDQRLIKIWFNLQAAKMLGEELNLELTGQNQTVTLEKTYRYDIDNKFLLLDDNGHITGEKLRFLKAINTYNLSVVARIKGGEGYLDQLLDLSMLHLGFE